MSLVEQYPEFKQLIEQQINSEQIFCYKLVAKVFGKYKSIFDGKTEYQLGAEMFQQAKDNHKGGYYVYRTINEVIFADIPYSKGGLYYAPRTILKCLCWGDFIEYDNGKIAYSHICPVQDMGMPRGYISTKAGLREAFARYQQLKKEQQESLMPQKKKPQQWNTHFKPKTGRIKESQPYTLTLRDPKEYQK